jgi:hypothetical protein
MMKGYVVNTVFLALCGVWVALMLACAFVPIYPVLGTPVTINLSSILFSSLTAPLLGPLWGTTSGAIFGGLVTYFNLAASIGSFTLLCPIVAALLSGLVLFNRWKEAAIVFALEMGIWFAHPFAWYADMPIITWEYWLVLILIVVPPIRKWIIKSIVNGTPATMPIALWCLAWIARIGDVATGNNIGVWIMGWGVPDMYLYWAPMTVYYAIADSLNCLAGALIGTAVLTALKKANIRAIALNFLEARTEHES